MTGTPTPGFQDITVTAWIPMKLVAKMHSRSPLAWICRCGGRRLTKRHSRSTQTLTPSAWRSRAGDGGRGVDRDRNHRSTFDLHDQLRR